MRLTRFENIGRDQYGGYEHPQLPDFGESEYISKNAIEKWENEMCFKLIIIPMDGDISEDHPAWVNYFQDGDCHFDTWEPSKPSDEAILLSVHDTEDGPAAWWAVERAE